MLQRGALEVQSRQNLLLNAVPALALVLAFDVQRVPRFLGRTAPQEQAVHFVRGLGDGVRLARHRVERRQEAVEVNAGHDLGIGLRLRYLLDLHEEGFAQQLREALGGALPVQGLEQLEGAGLLVAGQRGVVRADNVRGAVIVLVTLAGQCEAQRELQRGVFGLALELLRLVAELDVLDQTTEGVALGQQSATAATPDGFVQVNAGFGNVLCCEGLQGCEFCAHVISFQ